MLVFWFFDEAKEEKQKEEKKGEMQIKYETDKLPEIGEKFTARNIMTGEETEMTCCEHRYNCIWAEYEINKELKGIRFVNVIGWKGKEKKKKAQDKKVIAVSQIEHEYQEAMENYEKLKKELKEWREQRERRINAEEMGKQRKYYTEE